MPDPEPTIFAAVLAAGGSSRFGSTKQAVLLDGMPLVWRAVDTAVTVCNNRVLAVIGHDADTVLAAIGSEPCFIAVNEDHGKGLGTSIATAARACRGNADALLLLLADQPLITTQHLRALIDTWSGADNEIVASSYSGTDGPPVLFPSGAFEALESLTGDRGGRALFRDSRFTLRTVPFEPAATDIDTPADLAALV
ncbi:MAG: nucleotidyltransferase family protein [Gammaproteobacteria bacterium]|nr:nucleotidyltransferase family protein [Gammaproteobacteria bacterium]MDH3577602.1 nucleotidyltransferase family protein [Gammaproteobacteria bacterium]